MGRNRGKFRRGATAVVAAICLPALIGVMALAVDGGLLRSEGWRAQVAADAAAYAAARTYDRVEKSGGGGDPMTAATQAALAYASASFPKSAPPQVTVARTSPPARYGAADLALKAVVSTHPPRLFSGIFGGPAPTVSAASTSVRVGTAGASVVVLNPGVQSALTVVGSARIVVPGEIRVKSNASRAANVNNAGYLESAKLKTAGGYQITSGGSIKDAPGSVLTGVDPKTIVDPLEGILPQPSAATLPTQVSPSGWNPTNPYPIQPGLYPSGLTLNSGGMNYTMAPGLYYVRNGGFTVSNGVRVTGSGVTIYLENGDVNIQGGEGTTLTAPTGGSYNGVVFFQNSVKTGDDYAPHRIDIANGTNNVIQGTIYAPGAKMSLAGGSQTVGGAQLIVNTLNLSNDARYTPTQSPPAFGVSFHLAE